MAATRPRGGTRLFSRPLVLLDVRLEGRQLSPVTPDAPPLPLPLVLPPQGLQFYLGLAMMGHILADLHVLRGTHATLRPGVAELLFSHEATDDGQAGLRTHVLRVSNGAWLSLWVWSWLLMRNLKGLVDVRVLLLWTRSLLGLVDVRGLLGIPRWS